jgi:hypothetical protein
MDAVPWIFGVLTCCRRRFGPPRRGREGEYPNLRIALQSLSISDPYLRTIERPISIIIVVL